MILRQCWKKSSEKYIIPVCIFDGQFSPPFAPTISPPTFPSPPPPSTPFLCFSVLTCLGHLNHTPTHSTIHLNLIIPFFFHLSASLLICMKILHSSLPRFSGLEEILPTFPYEQQGIHWVFCWCTGSPMPQWFRSQELDEESTRQLTQKAKKTWSVCVWIHHGDSWCMMLLDCSFGIVGWNLLKGFKLMYDLYRCIVIFNGPGCSTWNGSQSDSTVSIRVSHHQKKPPLHHLPPAKWHEQTRHGPRVFQDTINQINQTRLDLSGKNLIDGNLLVDDNGQMVMNHRCIC